jgi:hypothetical protein
MAKDEAQRRRRARLEAALRTNLLRRKAQARARDAAENAAAEPQTDAEPPQAPEKA